MRYSIVPADIANDREAVLKLWKRNFNRVPEERFAWMYRDNPAGPAACWIATEAERGEIVGATAVFPRQLLIDGDTIRAGIAGDFAVDPKHRGFGPALSLQKTAVAHCSERTFSVLYGLPNKQSRSVLLRAGYRTVADVYRMTKPLRSWYYLSRRIEMPFITRALSRSVDVVFRLLSWKDSSRHETYALETPPAFDARFDELWNKASTHFTVIGERSSSYLNWRYRSSPHETYSIFSLVRKDTRSLLGYIVYHTNENKANIADLLSLDLDSTLDTLLSAFISHLRKSFVDSVSVSYAGTRLFLKKLLNYGFFIRDREGKVVVYAPADVAAHAIVLNEENWYLLSGDNDI